jgi:type II secretory pathway pseudopilin PulG
MKRGVESARAGFSIIETVTAIAIVFVLAAILLPVFASARESARITETISDFRQIHSAIVLYQSEWGGLDEATHARDLGLPPVSPEIGLFLPSKKLPSTQSLWKSRCGDDRTIFESAPTNHLGYKTYSPAYLHQVSDDPPVNMHLKDYVRSFGPNLVIAIDPFCNPPGTDFRNPFSRKRLLSISLSGQVWNRVRKTAVSDFSPFSDPHKR